jgi:hypothetical protein
VGAAAVRLVAKQGEETADEKEGEWQATKTGVSASA